MSGADPTPDSYDCFVPAADYTDPEIGRKEREKLWPKVWQVACREEEIPKVGDYVRYDIAGESIIVTRVAEDRITAYYNACQHRGRQLVDEPRGNVKGFHCPYHGWSYKLDGSLHRVHFSEDWEDCPALTDGTLDLKQPRVGRWAGWVWITMDPDASSLDEFLGEAPAVFRNFGLENMRFRWYETLVLDVNWKVVVEAFNEGYHAGATHRSRYDYNTTHNMGAIRGLHSSFSSVQGASRYKDEEGQWVPTKGPADLIYRSKSGLFEDFKATVSAPGMRAIERLQGEVPEDAPFSVTVPRMFELYREEVEATGAAWPRDFAIQDVMNAGSDWHIFPNTVFLPNIDGIVWYRMRPHPDDDQKCVFDIWCLCRYPPGEEPEAKQHISIGIEAFKGRNPFLEQDLSNLNGVQLGMRSRGWKGAFTNPKQEVSIVHFHRMLHKYIDGQAA